jgi:hypothetical protein
MSCSGIPASRPSAKTDCAGFHSIPVSVPEVCAVYPAVSQCTTVPKTSTLSPELRAALDVTFRAIAAQERWAREHCEGWPQ